MALSFNSGGASIRVKVCLSDSDAVSSGNVLPQNISKLAFSAIIVDGPGVIALTKLELITAVALAHFKDLNLRQKSGRKGNFVDLGNKGVAFTCGHLNFKVKPP